MTETASIKFKGATIEYTIIRSARRKKTVEIALDPERGVIVRSPANTPPADLADLVRNRAAWILRHSTPDTLRPTSRTFTDGETLPYLGKEIPIVTTTDTDTDTGTTTDTDTDTDTTTDSRAVTVTGTNMGAITVTLSDTGTLTIATAAPPFSVSLEDGAFRIAMPNGVSEEERIAATRASLERWYRQQAARLLPEVVARWQSKVSRKKPAQVLIRSQRKRWGSCSSDGSIRLNWRIVMAEPALIDYIVVHELAHLAVMDHSPRYWKRVERALPDYRARRKRLNDIGAHFWF